MLTRLLRPPRRQQRLPLLSLLQEVALQASPVFACIFILNCLRSGKSKAKAKANKGANVSPFSEVALAGKTLAEKIASVRGALIIDKCFFPQVFLFHIHLLLAR